jgi:NADH-quinone oxidoreductase subunit L
MKAFIVNRVGDFGFGLGVMLVFALFGTLQYEQVFAQAASHAHETLNLLPFGGAWPVNVLTLLCLLLFAGAVGKSAQVPLHVWLPDAMEGPTPISALIHAATMVTAGVFMVARFATLYNLSPTAMAVVAVVGGVTAIFAATIALTQNDIKRIVAYSTVSQLGYMMMACGLGAYTAGIYHLLTHGAFKALLFLGCGSVIVALHHEQDIRRMGGLKDKLPITYWTFVIGSLALAGFPLTAGFFSKDEILIGAWTAGPLGRTLTVVGLLTAFLTAFYSFRLVFVAFWGPSRVDPHVARQVHEPSPTMTMPLIVLAALAIVTGYFGIPGFLSPALPGPVSLPPAHEGAASFAIMALATVMGLGGIALAYVFYVLKPALPSVIAQQWSSLYAGSLHKWYVDELYEAWFVRPTIEAANDLWQWIDMRVIDAAVNGVAGSVNLWSRALRLIQSGEVQHYALAMALGAVVILGVYMLL